MQINLLRLFPVIFLLNLDNVVAADLTNPNIDPETTERENPERTLICALRGGLRLYEQAGECLLDLPEENSCSPYIYTCMQHGPHLFLEHVKDKFSPCEIVTMNLSAAISLGAVLAENYLCGLACCVCSSVVCGLFPKTIRHCDFCRESCGCANREQ